MIMSATDVTVGDVPLREEERAEREEGLLHLLARLRGAEEAGDAAGHLFQLLLLHAPICREVDLVRCHHVRDVPGHAVQKGEPELEDAVRGLRTGDVVDDDGPLRPADGALVRRGVLLLPEDVPKHEGEIHVVAAVLEVHVLLRDFGPDRGDVVVRELGNHVAPDEAGLPHGAVPEEDDLLLDDGGSHRR